MIRFGLCCIFCEQPIKFFTTTAAALSRMPRADALRKVEALCLANAESLMAALKYCAGAGIGCFRIQSQILPVKTHPGQGYAIGDLPEAAAIEAAFRACGAFAREAGLRTCFHPDQFVVLNSPRPDVIESSIRELEYQAEVAEWVGADVMNIHAGGAYGDKTQAMAEFARGLSRLSDRVRSRLTVENDDRTYTPADLLPLCRAEGLPLVYDVHHHRCKKDDLSVEQATADAIATWDREPLFHLSSPIDGWEGKAPHRHHDYVDPADFPACWRALDLTVEVEAKAKELAVLRLMEDLRRDAPAARGRKVKAAPRARSTS
ncbi:UV DNA damage endonuclease [Aquisphaera giovannonii]|uniref:UV DNA damage endonuclease n=1 Tax=Aquisphaera giovannonii TaxID=406548 RepID=A0A5B9W686_9BACT|nr:UV DNA damage repair endonuclease UvsE [Aquisphaera giovannonii]QEH36186.1 UV DNA damage endonuclease [Aquisphaera giovannonii]